MALVALSLARHRFACQLVGLGGDVDHPRMIVPLRREILRYVQTVAFRSTDSPLRVWFKRLAGILPGSWTWKGPLVLVGSSSPALFDRFVLLTGDREIAFLFHARATVPWAVCKSGAEAELAAERRNHERAVHLLGQRVPALLNTEDSGSLTIEALPERFLFNIVAESLWDRRNVFVREALGHLAFCREIYRLLMQGAPPERSAVSAAEVAVLFESLTVLLKDQSESSSLQTALLETIGSLLPRMVQHGDFCVRNVLIVGGDRGRVLIDWEDLQERRWPLVDFALLSLSLKQAFAAQFKTVPEAMKSDPALARGLAETSSALQSLLGLERHEMRTATILSLACLCRQNLVKQRLSTARSIYAELLREVQSGS